MECRARRRPTRRWFAGPWDHFGGRGAPEGWHATRHGRCSPCSIVVGTVAFLALIPGLVLAGQPAKPKDQPQGVRLTISATTERIPLSKLRGPATLTVDAMARRIQLVPSKKDNVTAIATKIRAHIGMLCPAVMVVNGTVELGCRSRQVEAQITTEGPNSYLDINELRGLPWRPGPDAPPTYHYDPFRVGLGQSCPGRTPVVKGECLFKQGDQLQAAMQFRAALDTSGRQLACIRLGDLAVASGDPSTAAGWYRRAGAFGVFGRIADGRLCELDGRCLDSTANVLRAFDANGMPEPVRAEMMLRAARAEAYAGRVSSAARLIAKQSREHGMPSICREGGELLCRRLLLEAMREASTSALTPAALAGPRHKLAELTSSPEAHERARREYYEELLEAYLNIPSWEKGPLAVEMAQAAAPLAVRMGATGFAGNLLASLAPAVPDAQLSEHLLQAAETFLRGQNWPRARLVAEYARSRLAPPGAKGKRESGRAGGVAGSWSNPRWAAVFRRLDERAEEEEVTPEVRALIEKELEATLVELKNARGAIENAEGLRASAKAAKAEAGAKRDGDGEGPEDAKAGASKGGEGKTRASPGTGKQSSGGGAAGDNPAVAQHEPRSKATSPSAPVEHKK
jgi:hypothetical protein